MTGEEAELERGQWVYKEVDLVNDGLCVEQKGERRGNQKYKNESEVWVEKEEDFNGWVGDKDEKERREEYTPAQERVT